MSKQRDNFVPKFTRWSHEWKIDEFLDQKDRLETFFRLPDTTIFSINIYPDGVLRKHAGYVSICLNKATSQTKHRVQCTLGLKRADGTVLKSHNFYHLFPPESEVWSYFQFIERSKLTSDKEGVFGPHGSLTVFCKFRVLAVEDYDSEKEVVFEEEDGDSEKEDGDPEKEDNNSENEDDDLKDEDDSGKAKHKPAEAETQTSLTNTIETVSKNFEEIYSRGWQPDVVLNVGDKKFYAHKPILSARSSAFRLEFDMKKKETDVINIEDCDPKSFADFLSFLYTGKSNVVTPKNALHLYMTAQKFNVQELKKECCECFGKYLCLVARQKPSRRSNV